MKTCYTPTSLTSSLFNHYYNDFEYDQSFEPKSIVYENNQAIVLEISLPGIGKENIDINFKKDTLTVNSKIKSQEQEKNETSDSKSFSQIQYKKLFRLGNDLEIDNVKASYKDGILKFTFLKREEELSKKIEIS